MNKENIWTKYDLFIFPLIRIELKELYNGKIYCFATNAVLINASRNNNDTD